MHPKTERAASALAQFYATPLDSILSRHARAPIERFVLDFFQGVVRDVPAYRKFLEREGVDPRRVTSLAEFASLPPTTKANYQRAFSLAELCRGGTLENVDFLAVSTGSTGEPAAWPRFVSDEIGSTERIEQVLRDGPRVHERRTLGVICFALGSWVGGCTRPSRAGTSPRRGTRSRWSRRVATRRRFCVWCASSALRSSKSYCSVTRHS